MQPFHALLCSAHPIRDRGPFASARIATTPNSEPATRNPARVTPNTEHKIQNARLKTARSAPQTRSPLRVALSLAVALLSTTFALADRPAPGNWDFPQPHPVGDHPNVTTSVVLRPVVGVYAAPPPPALVSIPDAARLELSTPLTDAEIASITWVKDGQPLSTTDKTLLIPHASTADSGLYTAYVQRHIESPVLFASSFEQVRIQVGDLKPRKIVNISTRATINASSPSCIVGFVVESDPARPQGQTTFLIRAVGPSLAAAGVVDPLNSPKVSLFDAKGAQLAWPEVYIPEWNPYDLAAVVAPRVGAAPLPPSTDDFAILHPLPPGAYTLHVTSGDDDSGDVVLELYEVSEELVPSLH